MAVFEKNNIYVKLLKLRRIYAAEKQRCITGIYEMPCLLLTKIQDKGTVRKYKLFQTCGPFMSLRYW